MVKYVSDALTIMRKVTARVDAGDQQFTNEIMVGYLNDFYQLVMPQELKLYEDLGFMTFTIEQGQDTVYVALNADNNFTADNSPAVVDSNGKFWNVIGPPAYIGGYHLFWYEDPTAFYNIWPETQTYQQTRPQYVLYWDDKLVFRAPPNQQYQVKIAGYRTNPALVLNAEVDSQIDLDYWWRYIAYGAALDLLADYGETAVYNDTYPIFLRYKDLVTARTYIQQNQKRTNPSF